jgi:peptidoglycan-N-acetylglucosamine deacetylase
MPTMRALTAAAASLLLGLGLLGCPEDRPAESTCVGQQALANAPIFGTSMAAKQLALTFDDGPDARTGELSTYLKGEGIRAAFFVNGNRLANTAILQQLVDDGHVVANHTQTHLSLTGVATNQPRPEEAKVIEELTLTDAIIAPFVPANRFMFRAPFGDFDQTTYATLEASSMKKYVGHIEWDVGGQYIAGDAAADFACWQQADITSQACGDLYRKEANAVGKGIVLMHDALYTKPGSVNNGNTIDMVKYLVPLLKTDGFTFIGVDEVPDIAAQLPPLPPTDGGADGATDPDADPDASSGSSNGGSSGASSSSGTAPVDGGDPCPPAPTTTQARPRSRHAH